MTAPREKARPARRAGESWARGRVWIRIHYNKISAILGRPVTIRIIRFRAGWRLEISR